MSLLAESPVYSPGLHVLAAFRAAESRLTDLAGCRAFFAQQIAALGLVEVGAAWHAFPAQPDGLPGGFTAVVALTESHLSLHTWPEFGHATFDVFLSNYQRDNADRARQLYAATLAYFEGEALNYTEVRR
jgi:S-adenosylmethionine decarboxylase